MKPKSDLVTLTAARAGPFDILHEAQSEERKRMLKADKRRETYQNRSLFCLSLNNPFRQLLIDVIENDKFDQLILTVIGFNCILMAMDTPELVGP